MRSLTTVTQRRRYQKRVIRSGVLLVVVSALTLLASSSSSAFVPQPTRRSTTKATTAATTTTTTPGSLVSLFSVSPDVSAEEALARTQAHLKKLQQRGTGRRGRGPFPSAIEGVAAVNQDEEEMLHPQQQQSIRLETLYQQYILQSANSLKLELEKRKLNTKGRKPDLARRLAQYDEQRAGAETSPSSDGTVTMEAEQVDNDEEEEDDEQSHHDDDDLPFPVDFATIPLSFHAAAALHQAGFLEQGPSPIQAASLPAMASGESVLLHAPTGSGKTLSYVLPITEFLWRIQQYNHHNNFGIGAGDDEPVAVICTPTRELAAQVAGVASTLAPPNSVRLLSHPSNLMTDGTKELKNRSDAPKRAKPSIIVGSAKTVVTSLYGNEDFPAPPTPKPLALRFLKSVRVLVLDEVDRLLGIQGGQKHNKNNSNSNQKKSSRRKHEKPAAVLSAAVARHTLGKAQIVAASATVGRPLKRELARVLGLPPPKGPRVIVAQTTIAEQVEEGQQQQQDANARRKKKDSSASTPQGSTRLVTIPKNVQHFLAPVSPKQQVGEESAEGDSSSSTSSGQLLIKAYQVIQDTMKQSNNNARILLVLARGFGISTQHVIGALQHFNCNPPPISLLDALQENALDGTDHMMQVHRQVSGATGVGQSISSNSEDGGGVEDSTEKTQQHQQQSSSSSLWVTGEDTIRGLHLDGLDVVLVVGRPRGPDEYTHIAGRTGRAGKSGKVVAVISHEQAPLLRGWETMLKMKWQTYGVDAAADDDE